MFSTVEQFSTLSKHNLEGMDGLMANFFNIVADFKRKPYDLLDFVMNQFDRDYLEFNANIHELESSLQGFINASFEHISSTEHALSLLKQFQQILQRESLKDDLESKFMVIFHNYGIDLETVQRLYEKQKTAPPTVRNAPPVTGNVMWARQLMRRIEAPMSQFKENAMLMNTKESKKLVKVYNKIARTIIEFETLWHLAWTKGIEAAKSGLQATLIVRHPTSEKLHVNFDREILQLLRETKCLMRMGVEVPEAAKIVLLQEEKFKNYYNLLSYALSEYESVMAGILPITAPLLKPHVMELERVIQPGMLSLTWTSMNIDAYLFSFHQEVMRFNDLVMKIKDIVDNRLMRNLNIMSNLKLVDLPSEDSFPLDRFITMQVKHVAEQAAVIASKNVEVEGAVGDLYRLIVGYPLKYTTEKVNPEAVKKLYAHFSKLTYQAVLGCTQKSLDMLKRRVSSRTLAGFPFVERPFFDVNVELQVPHIVMNPPLSEIQKAINTCSRTVLSCSKNITVWESDTEPGKSRRTVYEVVTRDREVVRIVLLLTGAIEGAKRQVDEYISTFTKYDFLWKQDKLKAYAEFMATQSTLDDFEIELKKYVSLDAEITRIPPKHTIGAMSLETAPMKIALKSEAAEWKMQYSTNLHQQAKVELDAITQWMTDMKRFLGREINDLDDVRMSMSSSPRSARRSRCSTGSSGPSRRSTRCSTGTRSTCQRRRRTR
jgi:dynein heavy chain